MLTAFFARQKRVVLSRLGSKASADWWDADRWDGELADDLYRLALLTSETVAKAALAAAGVDEDRYDVDRTRKFLRAVAEREASAINETTREQAVAALDSDDKDVEGVFALAVTARAPQMATTLVTHTSGFATTEAAKQVGGGEATKTWITTSGNPRSSHAAMNGETVGIDDDFSNGMPWPGAGSDAAEVAGCQCEVEVSFS